MSETRALKMTFLFEDELRAASVAVHALHDLLGDSQSTDEARVAAMKDVMDATWMALHSLRDSPEGGVVLMARSNLWGARRAVGEDEDVDEL